MIKTLESTTIGPPNGSPSDFTDEQLMAMIQARRQIGLDLLHRRYHVLLKSLSMKSLQNESDAEDAVQGVFMEVWERADNYNPIKGRALSWLTTITRNRSIDRLRRREAVWQGQARYAEEQHCQFEGWTHVQEDVAQSERRIHMQRALATLPEAQSRAVKLAFYEDLSQRQIAARTGISLGTIKTRIQLGLAKLAVCLFGHKDLLSVGQITRGVS